MEIQMDADVQKTMAFMARNMVASKLVAVAKAVNDLALPLWGHHQSEDIIAISLRNDPISGCDQPIQSIST